MTWITKNGKRINVRSKKALTQNLPNHTTIENMARKKMQSKQKLVTKGKKVELKKIRGVKLNIMGQTVEFRNEKTVTTTKKKE